MNKSQPLGPLMLDVEGLTLDSDEIYKLRHPGIGGVIFFSRNYESVDQVRELVREIRGIRGREFLIAVDQEGGRVQRFVNGFTRLPPAEVYARSCGADIGFAMSLIHAGGWLMAAEILYTGVDFSFAPVLDVDCGISTVIGDRAFSMEAERVADYASAFRAGMNEAGMAAVGKHFPGHGGVSQDSHHTLPVDQRGVDELRKKDLIPFRRLIDEGLEGIMPAHVVYSQADPNPAGFSPFWISMLRTEMEFDGVIFSDDLSMSGAEFAGSYADRVERAMSAGCDMFLICNNTKAAEGVLDQAAAYPMEKSRARLQAMRGRPALSDTDPRSTDKWRKTVQMIQTMSHI